MRPTSCCEPAVSLWDLAAPQVIVEEAGGRFTDLAGCRGADGGDALASNGPLHDAALADRRARRLTEGPGRTLILSLWSACSG